MRPFGGYALTLLVAGMATGAGRVRQGGTLVNDPSMDSGEANTQSEAAIATHQATVVVGFNDSGEFVRGNGLIGYSYSKDGGQTFQDAGALQPRAGTTNSGDPTLAVDTNGTFFLGTLVGDAASGRSFVGVARSRPGTSGVVFSAPVLIGGLDPDGFQDKEWLAADRTAGQHAGNVYLVWMEFVDSTVARVLFSRSVDHGATFLPPRQLSSPGTFVHGPAASVGPSGELYAAWEVFLASGRRQIRVRRSDDGGLTFGAVTTVAEFDPSGDANATSRCGQSALNGDIRTEAFPSMDVDRSNGPARGRVYVAYAALPPGSGSDVADVFLTWSGDGGQTWSPPASIAHAPAATSNPDPTPHDNWQPTVIVGSDGGVSVFFYDRRGDPQNLLLGLYRAKSMNGGASWVNQSVSVQSFAPPQLSPPADAQLSPCYFGDYNGATRTDNLVHVVWGDARRVTLGRPDVDVRFAALP
jgi:hypothetical protein